MRRIVLTGGPGAGKTAVLELARRELCGHVAFLPEAATIVFGGGFPRRDRPHERRAAQRAIFHVQRELEALHGPADAGPEDAALVICDRGTIDGIAYWPGDERSWLDACATERDAELSRYDLVLHLRVPPEGQGYDHSNPVRIESPAVAHAIDEAIATAWRDHPRRRFVAAASDFFMKARHAIRILRAELPPACRAGACARSRSRGPVLDAIA